MNLEVRASWERFWLRPAPPSGLVAARAIVCLNALWILLSRPDLPELFDWPTFVWSPVPRSLELRYLLFVLPQGVETALYALLHVTLVLALLGRGVRVTCLVSGLLIYHFAPLEEILTGSRGPQLRGWTHPLLSLLILGFAEPARLDGRPSPEFRWPLVLLQVQFALHYWFAGLNKLRDTGLAWTGSEAIHGAILSTATSWATPAPWSHAVAASPSFAAAIAIATLLVECLFPLVLVSRLAAWILVPAVVVGHVGIEQTLGVVFLNFPLLLLYLDWDRLDSRVRAAARAFAARRRTGGAAPTARE